mmetsp:Transcript_72420/g.172603  ORF Transcript_72420/g.172603 Transcript_72420/m.172603 type:complete len:216 (-) Transcript_72420:8-655(-)
MQHLQHSAGAQPEKSPENYRAERRHYDRVRSPTPLEVCELPRDPPSRRGMPYASKGKAASLQVPAATPAAEATAVKGGGGDAKAAAVAAPAVGVQAPWRVSTAFSPPEPKPANDSRLRARGLLSTSIEDGLANDAEFEKQKHLPVSKHLGRRSVYAQYATQKAPAPWAVSPADMSNGVDNNGEKAVELPFSQPPGHKTAKTSRKNASGGPLSPGL